MSTEQTHEIPRHGSAQVAFAGVQLHQARLTMVGFVVGMLLAAKDMTATGIAVIVGSYLLNKAAISWMTGAMPGFVAEAMYRMGWNGYSKGLNRQEKIFRGDASAGNGVMAQRMNEAVRQMASRMDDEGGL
jgi:hypothetical protein